MGVECWQCHVMLFLVSIRVPPRLASIWEPIFSLLFFSHFFFLLLLLSRLICRNDPNSWRHTSASNLPKICPGFTWAQMEFRTWRDADSLAGFSLTLRFSTLSVICILAASLLVLLVDPLSLNSLLQLRWSLENVLPEQLSSTRSLARIVDKKKFARRISVKFARSLARSRSFARSLVRSPACFLTCLFAGCVFACVCDFGSRLVVVSYRERKKCE